MPSQDIYFHEQDERAVCTICGQAFAKPRGSRREVCSNQCKRERSLRYGASYRQAGREGRAKLRALFDGKKPTQEDILAIVQGRRKIDVSFFAGDKESKS